MLNIKQYEGLCIITISMAMTDMYTFCVYSSNYEKPQPPSHRQTDRNHRGESCVDCHGALSVWRGEC